MIFLKNRIVKLSVTILMILTLVISNIAMLQTVYAGEEESASPQTQYEDNTSNEVKPQEQSQASQEEAPASQEEPKEEPNPEPKSESQEEQKEEPQSKSEQQEEKYVDLDTPNYNISFGTVYEGDHHSCQTVNIYNYGNIPALIFWNITDSNNAFTVDAPANCKVAVGASAQFIITPKDNLKEGRYSAVMYVGADESSSYYDGVEIQFSVVVEKKAPFVDRIELSPQNVCITKGGSYQFSANVYGGNNPDTSVTWSVDGATSAGTNISQSGLLKVDTAEKSQSLKVTATSVQNNNVRASANVTLQDGYYNVSVYANPKEGGSVSGGGSVPNGNSSEVYAVANNGYSFTGWSINNKTVSTNNRYQFNVTGDMTVVANFEKTKAYVLLDASPECGGKVSGGGTFSPGNDVAVNAEPSSGYKFVGWKENGRIISTDKKYVIRNVNDTRRLTACFEQSVYQVRLTAKPENAGTLTGQGNYEPGRTVTIKAVAGKDYDFTGWVLDGKVVTYNSEYTIDRINRDYSLIATFSQKKVKTYEILSKTASGGGVIAPDGKITVNEGTSLTYTIVPMAGYKIAAVAVDGIQVGAVGTYTFTNVRGNHSIAAAFQKVADTKQTTTNQTTTDNKTTTKQTTTTDSKTNANQNASTGGKTDTNQSTAANNKTNTNQSSDKNSNTDTKKDNGEQSQSSEAESNTADGQTQNPDEQQNVETDIQGTELAAQEGNAEAEGNQSDISGESNVYDELTGVLQTYNVTRDEARELIRSGDCMDMFEEAYMQGYITVSVNNQYADSTQETADESFMSNKSISNFQEVFNSLVSEEELLDIFEGENVRLNFNIANCNKSVSADKKKAIDKLAMQNGCKVGDYFDVIIMKSAQGNSNIISELGTECEMVIQVPQELRGKDRKYSIVHIHENADGTYEKQILEDLDNNPDTITFRTDKFSVFAIAYPMEISIVKTGITFAILITIVIILFILVKKIVKRVIKK